MKVCHETEEFKSEHFLARTGVEFVQFSISISSTRGLVTIGIGIGIDREVDRYVDSAAKYCNSKL